MEHAVTEDEKVMYETMLKISKRVEIMYETLQKETEEKERLQLQLQATEEALEELKHNNQSLQTDNDELKMCLHEEKEENIVCYDSYKQKTRPWKSCSVTHVR